MRAVIAVCAAAGLTLGVAGAGSAVAAQGGDGRARTVAAAFTPPPIQWHGCSNPTLQAAHAQCGFVVVPLNYRYPHGRKIKLAVSRIKHTVPAAQYQGVMLVNPGGPDGSGLILQILGRSVHHPACD